MAGLQERSVMAMAPSQNRKRRRAKRQRTDNPSQEQPPTKKIKSKRNHRGPSNFSPEFWDNLSKVWLTSRALREIDRRNCIQPRPRNPSAAVSVVSADVARFARHGGPDLRHLRAFPEPESIAQTIASSRSSMAGKRQRSRTTQSRRATVSSSKRGRSTKIRRSSAYHKNFEQHMIDNNIYPQLHVLDNNCLIPEPNNHHQNQQRLGTRRPSLSPSRFTESAFQDFRRKVRVTSESKVLRDVVPIIAGNADIPNEGNLPFTNFDSMTGEKTVKAVPDFFDGAHPGGLDRDVRTNLSNTVIPTKHSRVSIVPNFFLEVKAPSGNGDVAERQAFHDGAYGARAIHNLQNYDEQEPTYDGNAHTYSSTYHLGQLKLYEHHVTAPTKPGGQPEYHMTELKSYSLTSDRDVFAQGVTAFRNLRDEAKVHRDGFIASANAKAKRSREDPTDITVVQQDDGSSPEEYVDNTHSYQTRSKRQRDSHSPSSSHQHPNKRHKRHPEHQSASGKKHHGS